MEQILHGPEVYDFRQYDRIWQRVAPDLEPYPGMGTAPAQPTAPVRHTASAQPTAPVQPAAPARQTVSARSEAAAGPAASAPAPAFPAQQPVPVQTAVPEPPAVPVPAGPSPALGPMGQLPGASMDPCCMGSAASEMLDVITGYIEEALSDRRYLLALVRQAPSWARQVLRDIASDLQAQARQLMAVHYLITGTCYRPSVSTERIYVGRWCPALRERYHAAACSGLNYARSAEDTTDPCLAKLFEDLSEQSYGHAEDLMGLLQRSLQR